MTSVVHPSTDPSSYQLIECPRDAMQGWKRLIATETKIAYVNSLLRVGFHTVDFGSFVSPKAIPQMADTAQVLEGLELDGSRSKLLAIVANERGAQEAAQHEKITYLGYPFSVSATFQQRNANSTVQESLQRVEAIQDLCLQCGKSLVIYLSMAFGNPYGDAYNAEILLRWVDEMIQRGIQIVSLADTVGLASPDQISAALTATVPRYPTTIIGVHLHSSAANWREKLEAAVNAGCRRIDGALKGIGGCPMAGDDLVGNMRTEAIVEYLEGRSLFPSIDQKALAQSLSLAAEVFV